MIALALELKTTRKTVLTIYIFLKAFGGSELESVNNQSVYQVNSVSGWRRLRLVLHYPGQGCILLAVLYSVYCSTVRKLSTKRAKLNGIQHTVQPLRNKQVYLLCKTSYGRNCYSSKVLPDRINLVLCLPVENRITIHNLDNLFLAFACQTKCS